MAVKTDLVPFPLQIRFLDIDHGVDDQLNQTAVKDVAPVEQTIGGEHIAHRTLQLEQGAQTYFFWSGPIMS